MAIRTDTDINAYVASCDEPGCTYEAEFDRAVYDWDAMVEDMKANGWKTWREQGEWRHICPAQHGKRRGF